MASIRIELSSAMKLKGEDKAQSLRNILAEIKEIEVAAKNDFSYPLTEIRQAQELLPQILRSLASTEAGRKRRKNLSS